MTDLAKLAKDLRAKGEDAQFAELRASLRLDGWNPEFPAIVDEHGVVLVGNRRMAAAKAEGIEAVTKTITFGSGDEADAARVRLALISNLGVKPLTKADRKRIAEHLYGQREWTMARIAEALNTTHKTISKDLEEFVPEVQINKHTKTDSNPKGAGRPKGSGRVNNVAADHVARHGAGSIDPQGARIRYLEKELAAEWARIARLTSVIAEQETKIKRLETQI